MKATPKTPSTGALSGCLATKSLKVFGIQGQHLLHGPTNTPELSHQMDAGPTLCLTEEDWVLSENQPDQGF